MSIQRLVGTELSEKTSKVLFEEFDFLTEDPLSDFRAINHIILMLKVQIWFEGKRVYAQVEDGEKAYAVCSVEYALNIAVCRAVIATYPIFVWGINAGSEISNRERDEKRVHGAVYGVCAAGD